MAYAIPCTAGWCRSEVVGAGIFSLASLWSWAVSRWCLFDCEQMCTFANRNRAPLLKVEATGTEQFAGSKCRMGCMLHSAVFWFLDATAHECFCKDVLVRLMSSVCITSPWSILPACEFSSADFASDFRTVEFQIALGPPAQLADLNIADVQLKAGAPEPNQALYFHPTQHHLFQTKPRTEAAHPVAYLSKTYPKHWPLEILQHHTASKAGRQQ
ncbi:hypothetical protein Nepgr_008082 [Nepenthes gracilis]|uniref:Uncharacterized protein n=1 Tax=Nepenthes gracilis TaxID=150966 RepID=A0AAD3S8W9_NEPGR|nr:hypothetical protein Nepgr_008082 [Nepenthes gracilis]